MSESAKPLTTPLTGTHQKSPNFRVIYSNIFRYRITLADLSLVFSTMADTGDHPNTLATTDEAIVVMSLSQAKSLAEYLTMIIGRFEREIGPINGIGKTPPNEREIDGMIRILQNIGTH